MKRVGSTVRAFFQPSMLTDGERLPLQLFPAKPCLLHTEYSGYLSTPRRRYTTMAVSLGSVPTDWDDSRKEYRCTRQVRRGSQSCWLASLNIGASILAAHRGALAPPII